MIEILINNPSFLSLLILIFSISLAFPLGMYFTWKNKDESGDWGGRKQRCFNWKRFRFEYGRFHYRTNAFGDTLDSWWKQESKDE